MSRRTFASLAVAGLLFGGVAGACSESDEPTPNSEQNSDPSPPTSQVVPPGNPQSGETGTDGTNTGGG
jgi:hypothetical protein